MLDVAVLFAENVRVILLHCVSMNLRNVLYIWIIWVLCINKVLNSFCVCDNFIMIMIIFLIKFLNLCIVRFKLTVRFF